MEMLNKWTHGLKKGIIGSLLAPMFLVNGNVVFAETAPEMDAKAAMAIDFESGKVLYNQNGDTQLGIASMTKMLVEYILFETIEAGDISWDDMVEVSEYAYDVSQNYFLSNVPLREGGMYSIHELYEALAIYSANGATIAIAEAIAGSEPAFVDMMIEKVDSWGITDYHLVNTTGLNNESLNGNIYPGSNETDENSMTARGVAKVATQLLKEYPEVLETSSIPEKVFREGTSDAITMKNWNWMLPGLIYERENVDGLKTGTTDYAGASITGTAVENDRRMVTVVMGAGDGQTNKAQRFQVTDQLLTYGYGNWDTFDVVAEAEAIESIEAFDVSSGKAESVRIAAGSSQEIMAPTGANEEDFIFEFSPNEDLLDEDGALIAPIEKGAEIGELLVRYEGDDLGYLDETEGQVISAIAAEGVEKANVFSLAMTWVKSFFGGLFNK